MSIVCSVSWEVGALRAACLTSTLGKWLRVIMFLLRMSRLLEILDLLEYDESTE